MRWHLQGEEGVVAMSLRSFSSVRQVRESPTQLLLTCFETFPVSKNVKLLNLQEPKFSL